MIDYSSCIERLEAMEDRLGIELSAVGAATDACDCLHIRGEIATKDGRGLDVPVVIQAAVYNSAGQIIAAGHITINSEGFSGFDMFEIFLGSDLSDIRRVRVWPKVGN